MDATPEPASVRAEPSLARRNRLRVESASPAASPRFFRIMAAVALAIAIVGFLPTFFVPLAQGTFSRPPIFYLHGLLFFGWVSFFFAQTWQVGRGRILAHREWGVLGAALAAAMAFSVVSLVILRLNQRPAPPVGPGSAPFAFGQIVALVYFGTCVAMGFANVRRPEVHKRLMLLATLSFLGAPIGRWLFFLTTPGQPPSFWVIHAVGVCVEALILVAMAYDWRTTGRVSWVYLVGFPVFVILDFVVGPLGLTTGWARAAQWLSGFGG